jgi:hypothetical protein
MAEGIRLQADSRLIYQPRFTNEERTRIRAIVRLKDDRLVEMEADVADSRSSLIRDAFLQYSREEIERFTVREEQVLSKKREIDLRIAEDQRIEEERQVTFLAKTKALEMPEVRDCGDPRIPRQIRRAKSAFEVAAWVSLALSRSLGKE